jgi:hypothetical protein
VVAYMADKTTQFQVFGNKDIRKIFVLQRDGVCGSFRILYNETISDLYRLLTIVQYRRIQWTAHVVRIEKKRNAYRILMGETRWKVHTWKFEKEIGGGWN